jgi:hypothetical protein
MKRSGLQRSSGKTALPTAQPSSSSSVCKGTVRVVCYRIVRVSLSQQGGGQCCSATLLPAAGSRQPTADSRQPTVWPVRAGRVSWTSVLELLLEVLLEVLLLEARVGLLDCELECSGRWLQWATVAVGDGCSGRRLQWATVAVGDACSGRWLQWATVAVGDGCSGRRLQWAMLAVATVAVGDACSGRW